MLKVLECFAGIGAASKALENLGIEHEIVDAVEIDKYAVKSFNAIHGTNFEPQDITEWDKDIEVDLLIHGSPCTSFSSIGKQEGGDEGSGTASSLMYESIRIIKKLKPKYVLWENVKNLLSKKHRHNFDKYLFELEEIGYKNFYQVLNAKDYGSVQSRERVYTISILGGGDFIFPAAAGGGKTLAEVLDKNVPLEYYISSSSSELYREVAKKTVEKHLVEPYDSIEYSFANARLKEMESGKIRKQNSQDNQKMSTLRAGQSVALCVPTNDGLALRRPTEKEAFRFMGFSDEDFEKAFSSGVPLAQLRKQAGNSIVVDVLMAIFKELFDGS